MNLYFSSFNSIRQFRFSVSSWVSFGKLNISINVSIYCKFSNVLMWKLYSFSRALITKYHKLGWLKQQNFVFLHPAGLKSQIKCWELISSEKFFLGSWIAFFSPCAFTWSFFMYLSVLISSSYKDTSYIRLGPTRFPFSLNNLFKGSVSKYSHILSTGTSSLEFWEHTTTLKQRWSQLSIDYIFNIVVYVLYFPLHFCGKLTVVKGNDPRKRNNANNCIEGEKKSKSLVFKLNEEYSLGQGRKISLGPFYKISIAL